jgi:hypothetical protein
MAHDLEHDHAERWDRSDVKALRELRWIGLTIAAIALRLGRTPAAVRSKLYRLRKSDG